MDGRRRASTAGAATATRATPYRRPTRQQAQQSAGSSVVDQINPNAADADEAPALPDLGGDGSLLPPPASDAPLVPQGD